MNPRITPRPYFRYYRDPRALLSTKNRDLSPMTANMLDVNTMKMSVVMERAAGMESKANITSDSSITIRQTNIAVATLFPFTFTKNLPSYGVSEDLIREAILY